MGFIESYKHLEKICGEILGDNRGVSAYIDEMLKTPFASYFVRGWDEDLKQLKHYRWVRNRIAHDLNCTEENMCGSNDAEWLDNFYSRIMERTDPLALYICSRPVSRPAKSYHPVVPGYTYRVQPSQPPRPPQPPQPFYPPRPFQPPRTKKPSGRAVGWIVFFVLAALTALLFTIVRYII